MKTLRWVRSSKADLKGFPREVQSEIGYALYAVQGGEKPSNAKPLHHDLSGVLEIVADSEEGDTYRAVYTVKLDPFVYVLHCFMKKSKSGIATPKTEINLIRRRLKDAEADHREYLRSQNANE